MKLMSLFLITVLIYTCTRSSHEKNIGIVDPFNLLDCSNVAETGLITPVYGYRFKITGDFNGNREEDTLYEHYLSQIDMKESDKFYHNLASYDDLVDTTVKKQPLSFVTSNNSSIDTLFISNRLQQFGLAYLKNEGDLNGDGNDEVSYVINHADWSNMNTWHIATYRKNNWEIIYSFTIRDWQLPNIPETRNEYGLFGLVDKKVTDLKTLNSLNNFEGLVRKMKNNEIEIIFCNNEAGIDTLVVDLSKRINYLNDSIYQ